MKKKIFILMLGFLLIGANLYAAGDLIVEGNVGIGTTTPATTLDVKGNITILAGSDIRPSTNSTTAINIAQADGTDFIKIDTTNKRFKVGTVTQLALIQGGDTVISGTYGGLFGMMFKANTVSDATGIYGVNAAAVHTGTANLTNVTPAGLLGGRYQAWIQSSGAVVSRGIALYTEVKRASGTSTFTNSYSLYSDGHTASTNAYHLYLEAHSPTTVTNAYGIWLEKQVGTTVNSGIVLDGDGAGSDIVFGPNQEAKIYSNTGELFAEDGAGNVTQISPHDPETGEWTFYSKNVKTGKVVRVDMEKLVKAVERLTGEQFMVETIGEVKQ